MKHLPDEVLIEFASKHAEIMMAAMGFVACVWHGIDDHGNHIVMQPDAKLSKDEAAAAVQAVCYEKNIQRLMFTDEAWMLNTFDEAGVMAYIAEHGGLENHPDRVEVVTIQLENIDGTTCCAERKIIRDASGKPSLGPLEFIPTRGSYGRFVGLLPHGKGANKQ